MNRSIARRREGRRSDDRRDWNRLLDDDHVGGLLARIRAAAYLVGTAAEADPAQLRTAGWLIEALADEARIRLEAAVRSRAAPAPARAGRRA